MEIEWEPGIGDPTAWGWITVAAYAIAAAYGWKAAYVAQISGRHWKTESAFWLGVTLIMIALGINKQLDLQSLLTEVMRSFAKESGWYARRRTAQEAAIVFMVISSLAVAAGIFYILRRTKFEVKIAGAALCCVLAFVVIRAASFHHVDALIAMDCMGVSWNAILELPGILLTGFCAIIYCRKLRR